MAVYAKIDASRPIENGLAVGLAPQSRATQGPDYWRGREEKLASMAGLESVIDGRFKHGGSTSWERPGSDLPA